MIQRHASSPSRRDFLKVSAAAGGGLLISLYLPEISIGQQSSTEHAFRPNAFLRIGADESVTVILGKSEMGTGIYTSLPMLVAEELEVDWRNVRFEAAPVDKVYFHPSFGMQMTGGSSSVTS
jgi:isoquinoline 1-oxidoreductase beta subunit